MPMQFNFATLKADFQAIQPAVHTFILFAEYMIPGADGPAKKAYVVAALSKHIAEFETKLGLPVAVVAITTDVTLLGQAVDAFVSEAKALGLLDAVSTSAGATTQEQAA
jgi:hypothetical protein